VTRKLDGRTAIVVGAGQTPGQTIGNGRATSVLYAREGARVLAVDRDLDAAQATVDQIAEEGGEAVPWVADATDEEAVEAAIRECVDRWGRLDILHNNVGIGLVGGDAPVTDIAGDAFDHVMSVNLKSMVLSCKHAVPVMRQQESGVVVNISSTAAISDFPLVAYKTSKAAVIALTEHVAATNARYGIRANAILPGLMETPMAIEGRVAAGADREELIARRHAMVPLRGRMGTAWDVAKAALFLASDDAEFITGVALLVDGGRAVTSG
jgi:NAD(P)-dependent dehydrogenase (short-subunit alcohol dehydrogenase family)